MVTSLIFPFLVYQFGDGLQITFANALRGISDVKLMMLIAFMRLLYHLTSRRLFLRLRNGLGGGRCLDGVPFRSDKCRINALVAFSLHDETPHSPSEYLILKTLPYGFLSFHKVESNNRLYVITCNSSFFLWYLYIAKWRHCRLPMTRRICGQTAC